MEYRLYTPGIDDPSVVDLRRAVWGANHPHTQLHFLKWMFQLTPANIGSGVLMSSNGKTTGFMGISPRIIVDGAKEYSAAHCLDLMVHPDFRSGASSLRLVSKCLEAAKQQGYDFAFGFPNSNSYKLVIHPKCGYKHIFSPVLLVRPLSNSCIPKQHAPFLPGFLRKFLPQSLAKACSLLAKYALLNKPMGQGSLIDHFDPRFDDLWGKVRSQIIMGFKRDAAYLNWRFNEHPVYNYSKTAWSVNDQISGYIISTNRELFDMPTTLIIDILAENNAVDITRALLNAAVQQAKQQNSHIIATQSLPGSSQYKALISMGFIPVPYAFNPKQYNFVTHDLGHDLSSLINKNRWFFNWSDMDVV